MNWAALDKELIWHPFTSLRSGRNPLVVTEASGIYLTTEDGRKIIDGISSWWVNLHGHSHPAIAEAIYQQAKKLEHVIFADFTHTAAIELAQRLKEILPSSQVKFFFSDNGSTAVEVAIKMALQYWHNQGINRKKIIAIEGAYHGDTFGSMAVGDRGPFTRAFHEHLFPVEFIPWPDGTNDADVLHAFEKATLNSDVAAFIFEPLIQGAAGMRTYKASLLNQLMESAKQKNIITIADEVFTGFGRTGKLFASEHLALQPDTMTLSKGLTGGTMALGITTCTQAIQSAFNSPEKFHTFFHGHSFTANPIACASALASLRLLTTFSCQQRIALIEESQKRFAEKLRAHTVIQQVHQLGTVLSLEIKTSGQTSYFNNLRDWMYDYFLERNVLLRPLGNVLYFLPSYAFTEEDLNTVYCTIEEFLGSTQHQNGTSIDSNSLPA